jgi:mannose-6-phosphate isomerase-like protein (cupin superfamily)
MHMNPHSSVKSRANTEHYVWGGMCEGWRLLAGPDLSVTQERIPPGGGEVPHHHQRARQLFFVLEGQLEMDVGLETARLHRGEAIEVPPERIHRVWNASDEDVLFLVISAPTTQGDRIESRG